MGNAAGKLNGAMVCDGGGLIPTGIYAEEAQDYDVKAVQRLILSRQLAPFYTGADEPDPVESLGEAKDEGSCTVNGVARGGDDGWWSYNLMVAQQQSKSNAAEPETLHSSRQQSSAASSSAALFDAPDESAPSSPGGRRGGAGHVRKGSGFFHRLKASGHRSTGPSEPPRSLSASPTVDSVRHERSMSEQSHVAGSLDATWRRMVRRHIECPICFLYYPQNTNYTRCCHKPLCTECFVQIKRRIQDACVAPTHCPYCVEPNLGVIYYPPSAVNSRLGSAPPDSFREPSVVMTDHIRPALMRELTAELQAKQREQLRSAETMALVAAATRRASSRNPSTSSPPPLPGRPTVRLFGRSPSNSVSRQLPQPVSEYMPYIAAMHAAGRVDLEEFLVQEAIRQSLADQEPPATEPARDSDDVVPDIASATDEREVVPDNSPLTLDDNELDAIANVTSRMRPAATSPVTSPVLTAIETVASPDDLMSFAAVDLDTVMTTTATAVLSPSSPPPVRPRRRPPPPPPPQSSSSSHSKKDQQPQARHSGNAEESSQPPLIHL
ncbi:SNF1-interacting protein [Coemansia sp. BCRC 34301]|nr:SNF1-interacting protein [Coemansia sp. BCRC 34301]